MDKENVYMCTTEYYSAMRKKENLSSAITLMNLEDNVLCEISQTKKKKTNTV